MAGGIGAALAWGAATVSAARSSRMIGAASALAWVMIVGLLVTLPAVILGGVPAALDGASAGWLLAAGFGNVCGLLLEYAALRVGMVGVVAPIASTEGAIAALLAVVAGEHLTPPIAGSLAVIAIGVLLASISTASGGEGSDLGGVETRRASLLSLAAAASFGIGLYATGRVGAVLPIAWAVIPARVVGVLIVAIPLVASGRLRLTRPAVPLVVASGLLEVVGFVSFAMGARHGIAIAAVLASQFAAVAAAAAFVVFRERLLRVQIVGVVTILVGVAVLTGIAATQS